MNFEVRRVIAMDHPSLEGHFPGNPIVPGVVILDEVFQAVTAWRDGTRVRRIVSAKFTAPLKPGESFRIRLNDEGDSRIGFECSREGTPLASGRLEVSSLVSVP